MRNVAVVALVIAIVGVVGGGYYKFKSVSPERARTVKIQDYVAKLSDLRTEYEAYVLAESKKCDSATTIQKLKVNDVGLIVCITKAEVAAATHPTTP